MKRNSWLKIFLYIICFVFAFTFSPVYAVEDTQQNTANEKITTISFDEMLEKAKEHSYDLKISDYSKLIAQQGVRGARSEYFPKFHLGMGAEYTKNFRNEQETTVMSIGDAFINPYTRFQSILGVNVSYNLFDFGIRGKSLQIAKEDVDLKELEKQEQMKELSLTMLDIYTKILVTTKQIESYKEILTVELQNLELKERLYKAKEISKIEINDENVKISTLKNKIHDLKSIRQESVNWLSFYTGEQFDSENLNPEILTESSFDINSAEDNTNTILWKIYEKQIKKKELEVLIAKRTNYPKINVYGRYYLYGADHSNIGRSLGIEPSNFSVGASVNMPLFDGFKNSANIKKTEFELQQIYLERDKALANLNAKIITMQSNFYYLGEQIKENNKIISELNDKENSMKRLENNKFISPIEYNDTKTELISQQIELDKNRITQIAITKGIEILSQ